MFLFFKVFDLKMFVLLLFSMKHSCLLIILGHFNTTYEEYKVIYSSMKHLITSESETMTLADLGEQTVCGFSIILILKGIMKF